MAYGLQPAHGLWPLSPWSMSNRPSGRSPIAARRSPLALHPATLATGLRPMVHGLPLAPLQPLACGALPASGPSPASGLWPMNLCTHHVCRQWPYRQLQAQALKIGIPLVPDLEPISANIVWIHALFQRTHVLGIPGFIRQQTLHALML